MSYKIKDSILNGSKNFLNGKKLELYIKKINTTKYEKLGIDVSIGLLELKKVYNKLMLKYHPDRATGNFELFTQIKEMIKSIKYDITEIRPTFIKMSKKDYDILLGDKEKEMTNINNINNDNSNKNNINDLKKEILKNGKSFDRKHFNKVYEQNRTEKNYDRGYGDFNESVKEAEKRQRQIMIYQGIRSYDDDKRSSDYYPMNEEENINNFSTDTSNFVDMIDAYRPVDHKKESNNNKINRRSYNNVDKYISERNLNLENGVSNEDQEIINNMEQFKHTNSFQHYTYY